jgi:hypothetical protein
MARGTRVSHQQQRFRGRCIRLFQPKARLFNNACTTGVNSYQLGIYGAWVDAHFFAQGLATFG